ncbi:MAG: signal peptidase II [Lachnospiraceae bacterium]
MVFVGIIVMLAAADLWLKEKIERQDADGFPRPLAGTKIVLYRDHNAGFPFGFMKKYGVLVRVIPLVITSALAGILGYLIPQKGNGIQKLGLSMLIGGSVSNLYDRWVRRYVVDYFSIKVGWLKGVVLNLGDLFVFLGAFILLIREFVKGSN